MNEKPHYLRFGIRDLFWVMVAVGLAAGWYVQWRISIVRERYLLDRQAEAIQAEIQLDKTKAANENLLRQISDQRARFAIEKGLVVD